MVGASLSSYAWLLKSRGWLADGQAPLNAYCKLVPVKQRVAVSCVVDISTASSYLRRASSRLEGTGSSGSLAMDSNRMRAADMVAEDLCERFSVFWRHEDLHDAGEAATGPFFVDLHKMTACLISVSCRVQACRWR